MTSIYDDILDSSSQGSRGERLYDLKPLASKNFSILRRKAIPDYQRPYAWEAGNITDLWNDIRCLLNLVKGGYGDSSQYATTKMVSLLIICWMDSKGLSRSKSS